MINEKWLILAHLFNMDGRAASLTITDRLSFIEENGIRPIILSSPIGKRDQTYEHYQVLSPAPSGIRYEMRYIIPKRFQSKLVQKIFKALNSIICLPFLIIEKIFIHLDSHWSWFLSAYVKGILIYKKCKPEIIYSTAGPASTHIAGFLLSRTFKLSWIAELHDPLVLDDQKRNPQRYYFNKWVEKIIFKHASTVIYFTENALKSASQRHKPRSNTHVIRPGSMPPDFSKITYQKKDRLHLAHFGVLAKGRNLKHIIQAIYELINEQPKLKNIITLDIYGDNLDPVSQKALLEYPIGEILQCHGRLIRQHAVEKMRETDVLLLLHGEGAACKEYIPSKVYEYMPTQRPILACTSKRYELGYFLLKHGYRVAENNSESIKNEMVQYIKDWQEKGLPDLSQTTSYSVSNAVKQLVQAGNLSK